MPVNFSLSLEKNLAKDKEGNTIEQPFLKIFINDVCVAYPLSREIDCEVYDQLTSHLVGLMIDNVDSVIYEDDENEYDDLDNIILKDPKRVLN